MNAITQSSDGAVWFATSSGVSRYDGTAWQTFTESDGLAEDWVNAMFRSSDGAVWFGTFHGGVSRYEVETWRVFTTSDGLPDDAVNSVFQSSDGALWVGTDSGVSRYDGVGWQTFTTSDGLADDYVNVVFQSLDGALWFGTSFGGLSRYDGVGWQTFTMRDGLAHSWVVSIFQSLDGALWVGTAGGVSRYDGEAWQTFTKADGLAGDWVLSIAQSADGTLWFGSWFEGVSRYDGTSWQTLTTADGLASDRVEAMIQSSDGALWFGTRGGVNRYDGTAWRMWTTADGLADDGVRSVLQSSDGALWFATQAGGVSRYDGESWQTFTMGDGLASNSVRSVFQADDGALWFGTENGANAFRRPVHALVQTAILNEIPPVLGVNRFFLELRGFEIASERTPLLSFSLTRSTKEAVEDDWSPYATINGVELTEDRLTDGTWTFRVRAKDRYGNVDPTPATRTFTIDLTAPTAVISSPKRGSRVSGEVTVEGSAFDRSVAPDLEGFVLEYGRGKAVDEVDTWIPIGGPQSSPVESSVLGLWDAEGLPDGNYILRIRAHDRLGHRSVDAVNIVVVSSLKQIEEREGGRVTSVSGTVDLMIPPNGLKRGGQVEIISVHADEQVPPPVGATATGIAYTIGPSDLTFKKRSTLTLGYESVAIAGLNEGDLAVFAVSGASWTRLGGTVDATANTVSVGIESVGTFALFEAVGTGGSPGVSEMLCQPRIISPTGGLYPGVSDISFRLGTAASVDVRIYGVSGNLVREIVLDRQMNSGLNMVQWDGLDRGGKVVRDGIYVVVVGADGKAANRTVGVLNR